MEGALGLYEAAAAQGNGRALQRLSLALTFGLGAAADPERGLRCLHGAAAAGELEAQLLLAELPGVPEAEAARWLRAAAEQGSGEAMLSLARRELKGGNAAEAAALLRRAVDAGEPKAAAWLAALREATAPAAAPH